MDINTGLNNLLLHFPRFRNHFFTISPLFIHIHHFYHFQASPELEPDELPDELPLPELDDPDFELAVLPLELFDPLDD